MRLNRDVLINSIIEHQAIFFRLLDYIDNNDGSSEIPEQLYLHYYNNEICKHENDDGQYHLSIPSMIENGIFIHHDKSSGVIAVERVIVDLLRFLDVKRAKELTLTDFEQMRSQLNLAVNNIMAQSLDSQEFADGMSSFNNIMSETHSKVKQNVNALTAQVDSLASEYKSYSSGKTEISVFNLYDKVSSLYNRFVLPCYEFINPSMQMVRTQSFSKSVDELISFFSSDRINSVGISNRIQLRKTAISSYYKDIYELAKKLEQFSNHLEKDRSNFLAVDSAYNQLIESLIPLRHGRKNKRHLNAGSLIFSNHTVLDGLSSHRSKFDAKLKWNGNQTRLRFKVYKEHIDAISLDTTKPKTLEPLPANLRPDEDRCLLISKLLFKKTYNKDIDDIHQYMHHYLYDELQDFKLSDVLYGLETFLSLYGNKLHKTEVFSRKQLMDERYYFQYAQITYKVGVDNV